MTPPSIKLRDGWTWKRDHDTWSAHERVTTHPVRGVLGTQHVSTGGRIVSYGPEGVRMRDGAPADVVLAVIQANAPEVLREFVAGLATPRDRTKPPAQWVVTEHEVDHDEGIEVVFQPMPLVGGDDGMETVYHDRDACLAVMHAHTDAVAADCYPELVARIAELETALENERSANDYASHDADESKKERDAARSRIADLEREVEALRDCRWRVAEWTHQYGASLVPHGPDTFGEGMRAAKRQVSRLLWGVEPPVEWVDGRATVGEFVLRHWSPRGIDGHEVEAIAVPVGSLCGIHVMHEDEATAKRVAIAVARAMTGRDGVERTALEWANGGRAVAITDARRWLASPDNCGPAQLNMARCILATDVEPPVEWVDGRATVGDLALECVRVDASTWTVSIGERLRVMFEECNEETAKRGAIAVARAMGGGT